MPGFLKKKRTWIGLLVVIVLVVGFMLFQSAAKTKKAEADKAAAAKVESPYAAIANGKADVEGGVIAVAAQRLFSLRARHFPNSPLNQPLKTPSFEVRQLWIRKLSKIIDGFEMKYGSSKSGTSQGSFARRS